PPGRGRERREIVQRVVKRIRAVSGGGSRMKMALIPTRKTIRAPAATGNGILGHRHRGDERGSRHAPADSTREGHRGKTWEGTGQDEGPARAGEKTPRRPS